MALIIIFFIIIFAFINVIFPKINVLWSECLDLSFEFHLTKRVVASSSSNAIVLSKKQIES